VAPGALLDIAPFVVYSTDRNVAIMAPNIGGRLATKPFLFPKRDGCESLSAKDDRFRNTGCYTIHILSATFAA
jgi:hypothetical protein